MKLSIHPLIRGKPVKKQAQDFRTYYECNGHRINLGYGWQNIEADWPTVFDLITVDGYATSAELTTDRRAEETFVSRELIMVDIDSGMTLEQLIGHEFYDQYGAGFYTTPSHTDHAPRFRIMFRLQQPCTQASELQKINRMLLQIFTQADAACKDATRIFYGTPDCFMKERRDIVIPQSVVDIMIEIYNQNELERMRDQPRVEHRELDDFQRGRILDLLKTTYVGQYEIWRNIGWGLKSGGFRLQDFQYVTQGMMNQKSPADAEAVWRSGRTGEVTMGTVIWFLRQHHGDDCLRMSDEQRIDALYGVAESKLQEIKRKLEKWQLEM